MHINDEIPDLFFCEVSIKKFLFGGLQQQIYSIYIKQDSHPMILLQTSEYEAHQYVG